MANSPLFDALAQVGKEVEAALGTLVDVVLIKRDVGPRSRTTGKRAGREIPLKVRLEGAAAISINTDRNDPQPKWKLTVFDRVLITEKDAFRWGGQEHQVVSVRGLARNETGERYQSMVETN